MAFHFVYENTMLKTSASSFYCVCAVSQEARSKVPPPVSVGNGGNATLPRGVSKSDEMQQRRLAADLSGGGDAANLNKRGHPVAFDLMAEMRRDDGGPLQLWESMPEYPSSQITSSLRRHAGHFPTEHLDNHQPIATTSFNCSERAQSYYRQDFFI